MLDSIPPKPQLAIRVGVTGHRLNCLRKQGFNETLLRNSVKDCLKRVQMIAGKVLKENQSVYASGNAIYRVISPLANGSDQFVAEEALRLDFELHAPLPFPQAEYENDFDSESRTHLLGLLDKAKSVFSLDGDRTNEARAYEAVGRLVLRQSDIIIALWDGQPERGIGGTGQIVREALAKGIPTIWIQAQPPHSAALLEKISDEGQTSTKEFGENTPLRRPLTRKKGLRHQLGNIFRERPTRAEPVFIEAIEHKIRNILEPPPSESQRQMLHFFYQEGQPEFRIAFFYRVFCKIFVGSWKVPESEIENFESDRQQSWLEEWNKLPDNASVGLSIERSYRRPFIWADVIADICADRHRSSFVATYALGALAVLTAFLGSHSDYFSSITNAKSSFHNWFSVELVIILGILLLVKVNKQYHWRERWIDYRLLAEGLRQMKALAPLGRVTPSFNVPAHLSTDTPTSTWFNWYFRATVREAGLVRAQVNDVYLNFCRKLLTSEITSQIRYHARNARRHEALRHRLHKLSLIFFVLTMIACLAHILDAPAPEGLLVLGALVLPAFGAAIQGIIYQGEFGGLARRSRAIKSKLTSLKQQIKDSGDQISFRDLGLATESFSEVQIMEQADWRSVFIIKEVSLP